MVQQVLEHLPRALADHYRLDREIGHGGMATVYLAEDLRLGRRVAVKVLRPDLAARVGPDRFLREIRTTARLTHPNILPLHDSGEAEGLLYYVMPYAEGETLRDRLGREGPLPLDDALRFAVEIAGALEYAHREHVIHRDVKPANILLVDGHALVADFGLAKALEAPGSGSATTEAGLAVGTPEYMSPEQASGDHIDGRTDIYALGCVLFEMLIGEPPFRGNTSQTILARHRSEPPPSVRVVRPDLPIWVEDAIRRALAKLPADRFKTAAEFAAALTVETARPAATSRLRATLLAAAALASLVLAVRLFRPRVPAPDPNKVVVYPLVERGNGIRAGIGQEIALMIGSALEHTEPLKWIDGWTLLDASRRTDVSRLGTAEARAITRQRAARYYLDGVVIAAADSSRVVLRLNDARGDSVIAQVTTAGLPDLISFPQLGLRAINQILPRLLEPGRRFDLSVLASRRPAAIADWLQGEREYRRSRYTLALGYQRRAVEADSALAFAALKGALAAEWEHEYDEAGALVELALRNDSILPPRYVHFAKGLREYYAGHADSATRHLQDALRIDSTWSEAWTALGEVQYHLVGGSERAAADAFTKARQTDPDFAPPLFHLAEIAMRDDRLEIAGGLIDQFRRTDPDSLWLAQLSLTLDCLRRGPQAIDWSGEVARHPLEIVQAAKMLASRGTHPACAIAGFRAVFSAATAPPNARWGATLGLQGILTAQGRLPEVKQVLDSAVASGLMAAKTLYLIQAVSGSGMEAQAGGVIAELGGDYGKMNRALLWYHGIWLAHRGDRATLARVVRALDTIAETSGVQLDISTARSIAARLALLQADTARAIALLREVAPSGTYAKIEWGLLEPFGQERLLLAQLLLARGSPREAIEVAAGLDHPLPVTYLIYLRQSLELRATAAAALGSADGVLYRKRLAKLM